VPSSRAGATSATPLAGGTAMGLVRIEASCCGSRRSLRQRFSATVSELDRRAAFRPSTRSHLDHCGHRVLEPMTEHVDVRCRVVVTGDAEVDLPVVGEDRHTEADLTPERHIGEHLEHLTAEDEEWLLGPGTFVVTVL